MFEAGSFDLVAVAQALHWFDYDAFWAEVRRVAKPGAFFCAWGYSWFEDGNELQESLIGPLLDLLEPYWAPNSRILWDGYRSEDIAFPFEGVEVPPFAIEVRWEMEELLAYIRTWSAMKRALEDKASAAAVSRLEADARSRFAGCDPVVLRMPISSVAGRVS
jgi:SAM-dependent methyltransferase